MKENIMEKDMMKNGNVIYQLINGNGYTKEYDYNTNGLIQYEGECLNGKLNGKGKIYYYGKIKYEGEFLNDKKNGKFKEYNEYGELINESEYLNGKKIK